MSVGDSARVTWKVTGLDCPSCAAGLAGAVRSLDGVVEAEVNFAAATIEVAYDPLRTDPDAIVGRIRAAGHDVDRPPESVAPATWTQRLRAHRRFLASAASLTLLLAATATHILIGELPAISLYLAATVVGGYYVVRAAMVSVAARRIDMNVLMTMAVIGALAIREWSEAATVTFLFAISLWLEERAMDRARHAIRSLLKLKPDRVRVLDSAGGEQVRPADDVAVGQLIQVRPSERIGLDGVVERGGSSVDRSAVTGESQPATVGPGDEVLAGTINLNATLTVRVTRPAGQSTISRIIQLVEQAQASRAPAQRFIDRFARVYTPIVVAAAAAIAVLPPLLLGQPFLDTPAERGWLYRALVLLVTACPCALVISTPVSVVSALTSAAKRGVLIKGGVHLETLASVHCVVFDKTGTLTTGRPVVTDVVPADGVQPADLLRTAAALESHSEHHIARAVLHHVRQSGLGWSEPAQIRVLPGLGLAGVIDGQECWLGNPRLAVDRGAELDGLTARLADLESQGKTLIIVGRGSNAIGLIAAADQVRPSAKLATGLLRESSRGLRGRGGAAIDADAGKQGRGDADEWASGREGDNRTPTVREGVAGTRGGRGDELLFGRDTESRRDAGERVEVEQRDNPPHRAHLVMLTGDNRTAARAVASQLDMDGFAAELLPAEKVTQVRRMVYDCTGAVAMVGDGINDAPALAAADVGIAMGVAGTDAALETADVALIGDDLAGVPYAIRLGRRMRATIVQNVWFAVVVKAAVLVLAVAGLANLWMAVVADMGSSLAVIANGLRLLWVRR